MLPCPLSDKLYEQLVRFCKTGCVTYESSFLRMAGYLQLRGFYDRLTEDARRYRNQEQINFVVSCRIGLHESWAVQFPPISAEDILQHFLDSTFKVATNMFYFTVYGEYPWAATHVIQKLRKPLRVNGTLRTYSCYLWDQPEDANYFPSVAAVMDEALEMFPSACTHEPDPLTDFFFALDGIMDYCGWYNVTSFGDFAEGFRMLPADKRGIVWEFVQDVCQKGDTPLAIFLSHKGEKYKRGALKFDRDQSLRDTVLPKINYLEPSGEMVWDFIGDLRKFVTIEFKFVAGYYKGKDIKVSDLVSFFDKCCRYLLMTNWYSPDDKLFWNRLGLWDIHKNGRMFVNGVMKPSRLDSYFLCSPCISNMMYELEMSMDPAGATFPGWFRKKWLHPAQEMRDERRI